MFVLLERHSGDVSTMPWRVRGTLFSWANSSAGIQCRPTQPRRPAVRPDPTRPWYVRALDSTGDEEDDDDQPVEDEQPEDEEEEGSDIDEDDEQLWEIFHQGLKAGKKLQSASNGWKKPAGRGRGGHRPSSSSSSNVTQVKKEKTGKCLDCGQFGNWKGDPECDRVKSGQTPLFKKHGANVLYFSLDDDSDHAEERTTVTHLYSDDPDEVLNWTPAEDDEEVTGWNPNPPIENPPIVNPPWVPYVVDWQPPPPAKSPPRIVDLDELENGTSDPIDTNIQDDDEDIHIQ